MNAEDLIAVHPEIYHMADARNFASILRHGLLSTSSLLDLFEIRGKERFAIESMHRPESIDIEHPYYGSATIRDQKPMDVKGLQRSLTDASPQQFFEFLNGRVFFWLTPERLSTMNSARAYRTNDQAVLVVDTASLLKTHSDRVLLSPMNSGATKPMPHKRSIRMFRTISDFEWSSKRSPRQRVVELTVTERVEDIMAHVSRVERWRNGKSDGTVEAPYRDRSFSA